MNTLTLGWIRLHLWFSSQLTHLKAVLKKHRLSVLTLLLMLLYVSLLTGCSSPPVKPEVVIEHHPVPVLLKTKCPVSDSPTPEAVENALERYKSKGVTDVWKARFLLMTDFGYVRTNELEVCNKQIDKLWKWDELQKSLENNNVPRRSAN